MIIPLIFMGGFCSREDFVPRSFVLFPGLINMKFTRGGY